MRKRLTLVDGSLAVILPRELLERYGIGEEVEVEASEGGLLLRPIAAETSFEEAAEKVFAEKDALLERLSHAY